MNVFCMCFLDCDRFLEIFQKPPSRASRPLGDSYEFPCNYGFLRGIAWWPIHAARLHNHYHQFSKFLHEAPRGDKHPPDDARGFRLALGFVVIFRCFGRGKKKTYLLVKYLIPVIVEICLGWM